MQLTLTNFKEAIDPAILQRGRQYYDGDRILELNQLDDRHCVATVEGTDRYQVFIVTHPDDGTVGWACDCPYDLGPVCKHVAAVLFALEAAATPVGPEEVRPRKQRKTRADRVREALATLSAEEQQDLLLELALNDAEAAQLILARYGTATEGQKTYARLVRDALRLGKDRHGFLDYWGAGRAAKAINQLLDRADTLVSKGQPQQALPVYQAVLEGVVPALSHADDSMGALSDCAHFAIQGLQAAAPDLAASARTELFAYCIAQAPKEPFVDWDWGWDLAALAADMAESSEQRDSVFAALDEMVAHHQNRGYSSDFPREQALMIKVGLIRRQDDDAALQAFLEDHLQYARLRMLLAALHIERGDLAEARRLCTDWLAQPQTRGAGFRADFLAILLDIAAAEDDLEDQMRLSEALFRETGHFDYYERLKALVGADAWPDYRRGLIQRVVQSRSYRINVGTLYIKEEMWDSLLAIVQNSPSAAPSYDEYLAPRSPEALSEAYEQLALATLEQEVNRQGYRKVCDYLQRMQQLGQGERVAALVAQLRDQYKRRRALLEELDKAFGR